MGLNVTPKVKKEIKAITAALWGKHVKYLGIKLSDSVDPITLIELNLKPIMNLVKTQLNRWQKLNLSWYGQVAALKMKVLPRFLSLLEFNPPDSTK